MSTPSTPPVTFDREQARRFLGAIMQNTPGCFELRIKEANFDRNFIVAADRYSKTLGSFYKDPHVLLVELGRIKGVSAYLTWNPADPVLLNRSDHKLKTLHQGDGIKDVDILYHRWLYADIDVTRKDGISATDEELAGAAAVLARILAEHPEIALHAMWGCSGNGYWIAIRLPDYPVDQEHYDLKHRALVVLAHKFGLKGRDTCFIDYKTKNASRIGPIPGTLKCKGANRPERPWRLATIECPVGHEMNLLPLNLLDWVATQEEILRESGVDFEEKKGKGRQDGANGHAGNGYTAVPPRPGDRRNRIDRAMKWMAGKPPSVCGNSECEDLAFKAACDLIKGWDFTVDEARPLLVEWMSRNPSHVWNDSQIDHKLEDANRKPDDRPRGYLFDAEIPAGVNRSWNGYTPTTPHYETEQNGQEFDVEQVKESARILVESNRIEDLYRAADFLKSLAILEHVDETEYLIIRTNIRKIKGYLKDAFDRIFSPHERAARPNNERVNDDEFEFTDLGNARRLRMMYGHRMRYCKPYGDWLIYDGKRWKLDERLEIETFAKRVPPQVLTEIPPGTSEEGREIYLKWATTSQSKERLTALVHTARSMVSVIPTNLDQDPWLLNVQNGTINLETGEFRQHNPRDLITKIANAAYDPDAICPIWDKFIFEIMSDNSSVAEYIRRAIGYSITGIIREHVLFFLQGRGRNGKTVLLNTLSKILGDYANQIDSDLLLDQKNKPHPTGLTELEGRRLISADESDEGHRLAEAQVKKLTGGGHIQARRMNQDFYTFFPTHHMFYAANYRPDIRGMDPGMWRRIKLIEFKVAYDVTLPNGKEPDYQLEQKLVAEASGILNWMLRGCREWQEIGLAEPLTITMAVNDYRDEMDMLGWFLKEKTNDHQATQKEDDLEAVKKKQRAEFSVLYVEYQRWCKDMNAIPLGPKRFSSQLSDRGYKTLKSNSNTFKVGISLKITHGDQNKELPLDGSATERENPSAQSAQSDGS